MKVSRREFVRGGIATGAVVASGLIVVGCGNDVELAHREVGNEASESTDRARAQ